MSRKVASKMKLHIPYGVDVSKIKSDLGKDAWKALWFISYLTVRRYNGETNCLLNISCHQIRNYCHPAKYKGIINYLVEQKIISVNDTYAAGKFTKSFNLHCDFSNKGVWIDCEDKVINRKKEEDNKRKKINDLAKNAGSVDEWLLVSMSDIWIDKLPQDILDEDKSNDFKGWLKIIRSYEEVTKIRSGGYDYTIDDYGRRHSPITRISKGLRRLIKFNSAPNLKLYEVDIRNSQPLFLAALMLKEWDNSITKPLDLLEYVEVVGTGMWYEKIQKVMGVTRDEAKEACFGTFYGEIPTNPSKYNVVQTFLSQRYPTVWKFICENKSENYRKFSWKMQRTESAFMFGKIIPRVRELFPCARLLTIHDSIICDRKVKNYLCNIIHEEAKNIGIEWLELNITKLYGKEEVVEKVLDMVVEDEEDMIDDEFEVCA